MASQSRGWKSVLTVAFQAAALLLWRPVALAQDETPVETPSTITDDEIATKEAAEDKISTEFSDPLTTVPQFSVQDAYTPINDGTKGQLNRVLFRVLIPRVPSTSLLPFDQLIRPNFSLVTAPIGKGKETRTGFGDIQLFDLGISPWPERKTGFLMGLGPVFVFPTATYKEGGQQAWQVGPAFGLMYKGFSRFLLGCLIQNSFSFAYTTADHKAINALFFQPVLMAYIGRGFYVKSADASWAFGWNQNQPKLIPLGAGIGHVFLHENWPPINAFVSGEHTVYKENAKIAPDTTIRFGLTVAFPQWSPW